MNGSLSSGTSRLVPPKIEIRCNCGKRYRVSATKAGKRVRCKNCRLKITVPGGDGPISMRSRKAILAEFGIDPEQAEQAYELEKKNGYLCALCSAKLRDDDLKAAYGEAGLVCSSCRASAVGERPGADEKKEKKKAKKELDSWTTGISPEAARRKALGFGALFFFGTAGFGYNVIGLGVVLSLVIAAAVAYGGARAILNSERVAA